MCVCMCTVLSLSLCAMLARDSTIYWSKARAQARLRLHCNIWMKLSDALSVVWSESLLCNVIQLNGDELYSKKCLRKWCVYSRIWHANTCLAQQFGCVAQFVSSYYWCGASVPLTVRQYFVACGGGKKRVFSDWNCAMSLRWNYRHIWHRIYRHQHINRTKYWPIIVGAQLVILDKTWLNNAARRPSAPIYGTLAERFVNRTEVRVCIIARVCHAKIWQTFVLHMKSIKSHTVNYHYAIFTESG